MGLKAEFLPQRDTAQGHVLRKILFRKAKLVVVCPWRRPSQNDGRTKQRIETRWRWIYPPEKVAKNSL